uniref:24-methylenesterol C-methyltransferase 2-like n=1 Tax=Erigeron canadensis TaxID=72917 RepID=UPI001CB98C6D|nr:24-methylenesterol C-methyltransferase 2-like [Erigeron canadensis]
MGTIAITCISSVLAAGGLCWLLFKLGPKKRDKKHSSLGSVDREQVQESFNNYSSFFNHPKKIQSLEKVPEVVDSFYNLVTEIYEWGWGDSFHFAPTIPGKSKNESIRVYQDTIADLMRVKPGQTILDVGCGVGGPMRAIATHSGCNVVGITINEYQVKKANSQNKKFGMEKQCEVIQGNFLKMTFQGDTFDGAYSIDATVHAPNLVDVYSEIFRVLKPGSMYVSNEWVTTDVYNIEDPEHVKIVEGIEKANAFPGLRKYFDIGDAAKKAGFEVVMEKDYAKPPAKPWWLSLQMGKFDVWRSRITIMVLERLRIMPKGTLYVHDMRMQMTDYIRGAEMGIFSPLYIILCRKPEKTEPEA